MVFNSQYCQQLCLNVFHRFGAHPIDGKAIKRSVKMKNSGPVGRLIDVIISTWYL